MVQHLAPKGCRTVSFKHLFLWSLIYCFKLGGLDLLCQPEFQKTEVNRTVLLCCNMNNNSSFQGSLIRWLKDDSLIVNERITNGQKNIIDLSRIKHNEENGELCLEIRSIQTADAGIYTCTVFSDCGKKTGTINLEVTESILRPEQNDCRAHGAKSSHTGIISLLFWVFILMYIIH